MKWGPFEKGDILDSSRLLEVFEKYRPSAVIHFAAFAYVGESVESPGKYYTNNVAGTINLLEAMRLSGCNNIVFSSTCATFGEPENLPITELAGQNPINPYGRSKLMIEQILKDYDAAYNLKYVALRYFNAAGADPDCEIGEDHSPETHLIPLVLDAALGRRENIEIYGTDYDTPDGTAIRDYIHVTDLAEAHVKSLQMLKEKKESSQFNLGNGIGTSVKDIIDMVVRISGKKVPVIYGQRRAGDPPALVAGAAKASEELNWVPSYSDLETIIKTAWNWHSRKSNIYLGPVQYSYVHDICRLPPLSLYDNKLLIQLRFSSFILKIFYTEVFSTREFSVYKRLEISRDNLSDK